MLKNQFSEAREISVSALLTESSDSRLLVEMFPVETSQTDHPTHGHHPHLAHPHAVPQTNYSQAAPSTHHPQARTSNPLGHPHAALQAYYPQAPPPTHPHHPQAAPPHTISSGIAHRPSAGPVMLNAPQEPVLVTLDGQHFRPALPAQLIAVDSHTEPITQRQQPPPQQLPHPADPPVRSRRSRYRPAPSEWKKPDLLVALAPAVPFDPKAELDDDGDGGGYEETVRNSFKALHKSHTAPQAPQPRPPPRFKQRWKPYDPPVLTLPIPPIHDNALNPQGSSSIPNPIHVDQTLAPATAPAADQYTPADRNLILPNASQAPQTLPETIVASKSKQGKPLYPCPFPGCGKLFVRKFGLKTHSLVHDENYASKETFNHIAALRHHLSLMKIREGPFGAHGPFINGLMLESRKSLVNLSASPAPGSVPSTPSDVCEMDMDDHADVSSEPSSISPSPMLPTASASHPRDDRAIPMSSTRKQVPERINSTDQSLALRAAGAIPTASTENQMHEQTPSTILTNESQANKPTAASSLHAHPQATSSAPNLFPPPSQSLSNSSAPHFPHQSSSVSPQPPDDETPSFASTPDSFTPSPEPPQFRFPPMGLWKFDPTKRSSPAPPPVVEMACKQTSTLNAAAAAQVKVVTGNGDSMGKEPPASEGAINPPLDAAPHDALAPALAKEPCRPAPPSEAMQFGSDAARAGAIPEARLPTTECVEETSN
ncbi:hypothetical protein HDU96_000471 [Phlyctochytrium bullatum]|nr:hypothetical protein HDU96_000471 [Phlyctochytrium bullatum]